MKILKNLVLTAFITIYFGCMQEQEVEELTTTSYDQAKKNQPSINNKAEIIKDDSKQEVIENATVTNPLAANSVVSTIAEKPWHPSDGFLYNANKAEPWKAYQNYDQYPSRFGDDDFFLWSFKVNPRTTDLFRP